VIVVGLKIEKGRIAGSVIEKGFRSVELKESFSLPFASDVELSAILRDKAKSWAGSRIVCSIPGHRFSQRMLRFPFGDRKRLEKALPFEIEDIVPFSLDDMELDHVTLGAPAAADKQEFRVLGMMLPKSALRQQLDALAAAGLDPHAIVPSYIGLYSLVKTIPVDGAALFIDGSDACLKNGNEIVACRSFSDSRATTGLRHTLKAMEIDSGAVIEKVYLLSEDEKVRTELIDAGLSVNMLSSEYHGRKASDGVSLGLALTEQVNFRKGEFAYKLADAGSRKQKRTLIIAGAIAAVIALANLGIKYYLVQSAHTKLEREMKDVYRQTFPDAKSTADPLRQMRTKVDEAQKKFGVLGNGSSALDVMKSVTEGIPKEVRVSFQEFILEGGLLKLSGEASSFESIDKMKAELLKAEAIADVQVQDSRMGVDNKVKFRFDIKLKQPM